jgi:hypothetical protein
VAQALDGLNALIESADPHGQQSMDALRRSNAVLFMAPGGKSGGAQEENSLTKFARQALKPYPLLQAAMVNRDQVSALIGRDFQAYVTEIIEACKRFSTAVLSFEPDQVLGRSYNEEQRSEKISEAFLNAQKEMEKSYENRLARWGGKQWLPKIDRITADMPLDDMEIFVKREMAQIIRVGMNGIMANMLNAENSEEIVDYLTKKHIETQKTSGLLLAGFLNGDATRDPKGLKLKALEKMLKPLGYGQLQATERLPEVEVSISTVWEALHANQPKLRTYISSTSGNTIEADERFQRSDSSP